MRFERLVIIATMSTLPLLAGAQSTQPADPSGTKTGADTRLKVDTPPAQGAAGSAVGAGAATGPGQDAAPAVKDARPSTGGKATGERTGTDKR
jgi:hypothetical protein